MKFDHFSRIFRKCNFLRFAKIWHRRRKTNKSREIIFSPKKNLELSIWFLDRGNRGSWIIHIVKFIFSALWSQKSRIFRWFKGSQNRAKNHWKIASLWLQSAENMNLTMCMTQDSRFPLSGNQMDNSKKFFRIVHLVPGQGKSTFPENPRKWSNFTTI